MPLGGHRAFLTFSALLIGRLSCAAFIGSQFSVASASLSRLGCSLRRDDSLESSSTTTNITSCSGPSLLVGALIPDSFIIALIPFYLICRQHAIESCEFWQSNINSFALQCSATRPCSSVNIILSIQFICIYQPGKTSFLYVMDWTSKSTSNDIDTNMTVLNYISTS